MTLLTALAPSGSDLSLSAPAASSTAGAVAPSVVVPLDATISPPAAEATAHAETSETSYHFTWPSIRVESSAGACSASSVGPETIVSDSEAVTAGDAVAEGASPSTNVVLTASAAESDALAAAPTAAIDATSSPASGNQDAGASPADPALSVDALPAAQSASAAQPSLAIDSQVSPPAAQASADAAPGQAVVDESNDVAAAGVSAAAAAPAISLASVPPAAPADAGALPPMSGWDIASYLAAAHEALLRHTVVIEAELTTAEAALNSASTPAERDDALEACDLHAARLTYCGQALREVSRALTLTTMYEPIGVP